MTADLQDAADRGLPLAVLTVSEGTIYGRFGFGPAVFQHGVTVDTGALFALRSLSDDGSVALLDPAEAWPAVASVFGSFHERTRGSVERPRFYQTFLTAEFDYESGPDRKLWTAVHLDATGSPDGYVAYRPGPREDRHRSVKVTDLVALTPAAYLRLWRFLADLDLSDSVEWDRAPVDDPLPWALVDPFRARVTKVTDALWVRVLDVPTALEARPWGRDGDVVIDVVDPLGHASGRFRLVARDGLAEVTATDAEPAVRLEAETLGALYLGGVRAETLHRAGRLSGPGVETFAGMLDTGPAPYCITGF
jgi:predicted acetyltransferase